MNSQVTRYALLALVVLVKFTTSLAGQEGNAIVIGTQLEPTQLDPTAGTAAATAAVLFPDVYEGLVRLAANGKVEPLLATGWELSPDRLKYVFHLRRGVRFHDGTAFDAAIVKFSLERAIATDSINSNRAQLAHIDSVETVDPYTAIVRLRSPYSGLLQVLGWYSAVMVSPGSASNNSRLPVGTGPFRYVTWRHGESIELARNPDYWGTRPALDRATFRFIGDPSAALSALKAGDIDAYDAYPAPENVEQLSRDPHFRIYTSSGSYKAILALNNARKPFNDLRVRRALAYAIDRKAIIQGAMFGRALPIGSHYAPIDNDYVDLTDRYPHDVTRARALLAEAGYPNGFEATLKLPPLSYARRSGEIIASQLLQVGIHVKLVNVEWATWLAEVFGQHQYDLTLVMHVEPMDYEIYGRDDYYFGYSSPQLKALLEAVDHAATDAARGSALKAVQRHIADDAVNVFLFTPLMPSICSSRVRNLFERTPEQIVNLTTGVLDGPHPGSPTAGSTPAGYRIFVGLSALVSLALVLFAVVRAGPVYLASKALVCAGVVLGASVLTFAVVQLVPGDPATFILDVNATPAALAALRHKLALDEPLPLRYGQWLWAAVHGDFGVSYLYRVPVADLIRERLQVSLPLMAISMLLSTSLAVLLGIYTALHHGRVIDAVVSTTAQITNAIPEFWLGLMLVWVFGETLHWVSAGGFPGWENGVWPPLRALAIPAVALALPQAAILGRVLRSELIGSLREDYFRTARAKGLSESASLLRHGLPNVAVPALTVLALQASFLLAGAVIVENVFSLPGLGRLVVQAVMQRDLIVVEAVVLLLVAAVVAIMTLVDMLCAAMDPRWRSVFKP